MIRTSDEYRASIRDGRQIYVNGEKVADVTTRPQFKPIVDIRARIYDMQHEVPTREVMTYLEGAERSAVAQWQAGRAQSRAAE